MTSNGRRPMKNSLGIWIDGIFGNLPKHWLAEAIEGRVHFECHISLTKRTNLSSHQVDGVWREGRGVQLGNNGAAREMLEAESTRQFYAIVKGLPHQPESWQPELQKSRVYNLDGKYGVSYQCPEPCRSGKITCPSCYGYGRDNCSGCNGSGEMPCPNKCNKGTIVIQVPGPVKDGKATSIPQEAACPTCLKRGVVRHPDCNGNGYITCGQCYGDKRVECPKCSGTAWITEIHTGKLEVSSAVVVTKVEGNPVVEQQRGKGTQEVLFRLASIAKPGTSIAPDVVRFWCSTDCIETSFVLGGMNGRIVSFGFPVQWYCASSFLDDGLTGFVEALDLSVARGLVGVVELGHSSRFVASQLSSILRGGEFPVIRAGIEDRPLRVQSVEESNLTAGLLTEGFRAGCEKKMRGAVEAMQREIDALEGAIVAKWKGFGWTTVFYGLIWTIVLSVALRHHIVSDGKFAWVRVVGLLSIPVIIGLLVSLVGGKSAVADMKRRERRKVADFASSSRAESD